MLSITPIASGSKGNCTLVQTENTNILVDIGIPLFYAEASLKKLGVEPNKIDAVFVTHEHTDHINGVQAFAVKYDTPVYTHESAAARIARKLCKIAARKFAEFHDGDFFVGDMTVSPFALSHDAPCTGYSFSKSGAKISMLTDAGHLTDALIRRIADSDAVLIEANHDVDMLKASKTYPAVLKKRILSIYGHLSNADSGAAAAKLALGGITRQFILAHLSQENNYPELALSSVGSVLSKYNIKVGEDVILSIAEQYKLGQTVSV
jgi:phosphoribosyl 1,2-cyclic phosphodiesterase